MYKYSYWVSCITHTDSDRENVQRFFNMASKHFMIKAAGFEIKRDCGSAAEMVLTFGTDYEMKDFCDCFIEMLRGLMARNAGLCFAQRNMQTGCRVPANPARVITCELP